MNTLRYGDDRLPENFWSRVSEDSSGCWLWTGAQKGKGYANVWHNKRDDYGHRVAYRELVGEIPAGLVIDHLCRNRLCVNPQHMEPVTNRENLVRGVRFEPPTHCKRGHEMTQENTARWSGRRQCRTCARDHDRNRRSLRSA